MAGQHHTIPKQTKLTLAKIKALPTTGKAYTVKDTESPNLQCRVLKTGHKSIEVFRAPRGSRTPTRVKIKSTSTMAAIRAEAAAISSQLAMGINPNEAERQRRREAAAEVAIDITLGDAFAQYLASKQLSKNTADSYTRAMRRMADWTDRPLRSITKLMVLERFNSIGAVSTTAATKWAQVLRAVWNLQNDLSDDDDFGICPTVILNRQKRQWSKSASRNRRIPANRLGEWFAAVRALPSQIGDGERMGAYLEFMLLTGLRRREAGYLQWCDVDLKDNYFVVRDTKNGSDHCLPLTGRARELVVRMRDNGALVFGVEEPKKAIARVARTCGIEFSSHDLRRTYAGLADTAGIGGDQLKAILNHAAGADVTGGHYTNYQPIGADGHIDLDQVHNLCEAMQRAEDYILQKARLFSADMHQLRVV